MGPWRSAGGLSGAKSTHICTCFGVKPVAEVRALLRSTLCLFLPLSLRKQVLHASQCTKLAGWAKIWLLLAIPPQPWVYISCQLVLGMDSSYYLSSGTSAAFRSLRIRALHLFCPTGGRGWGIQRVCALGCDRQGSGPSAQDTQVCN